MSRDHVCPVCKQTFRRRGHLREHQEAKRHYRQAEAPLLKRHRWKLAGGAAILGVALLTVLDRGDTLPTTQSHWHADYSIEICGKTLRPQAASPGDVHTHGDGLIHIHPSSYRTAGENANLGRFFASFGGTLRESLLDVPGVGTYRNGDRCGNGERGRLAVYVDGDPIRDPRAYVPQDGDDIRVVFGPPTSNGDGGG